MAVAVGTTTTAINNGASSVTFSHTTASGANRLLVVAVHSRDGTAGDRIVSGVTYGGTPMTRAGAIERVGGGFGVRTEVWYLIAPAVGTASVVVTMGGVCDDLSASATAMTGARQTAPEAVEVQNSGGSNVTTSITTLTKEALLYDACIGDKTGAFTAGAGQTKLYDTSMTGSGGTASHKTPASVGTDSMSQTQGGAARLAHVVLSIANSDVLLSASRLVTVTEAVSLTLTNPEECLYGQTLGGSITPTNPGNMTDLAFNGLVAEWTLPGSGGTVDYTAIQDTVESDISIIAKATLEVRFRASVTLTDDTMAFQIRPDAGAFTTLETFSSSNQPPTTLSIKSYDVTALLNTIAKINGANFRFNGVRVGANDATWFVDEIRICLRTNKVFTVAELIGIEEAVTLSVFPQFRNLPPVDDDVAVDEDVTLQRISLVNVFDAIAITEAVTLSLNVLNVSVVDPFHVLVTEVVEVVDLVVEVGVVMDAITVTEVATLSLDALHLSVVDLVAVTEDATLSLPELLVSVFDTTAVTEHIDVSLDALYLDASDTVSVAEDVVLEFKHEIDVHDDLTVTEQVTVVLGIDLAVDDSITIVEDAETLVITGIVVDDDIDVQEVATLAPDVLFLFVLDPFHVLITEVVEVLDLVVEVGVVMDAITVTEAATASLDVLNLSVNDLLSVAEDVTLSLPELFASVFDTTTTTEQADVFLDVLNLDFSDTVSIAEDAVLEFKHEIDVHEDIAVTEQATVDLGIDLAVDDSITIVEDAETLVITGIVVDDDIDVQEVATLAPDVLFLFVLDPFHVLITEHVDVVDLVVEVGVVSESIPVAEAATVSLDVLNISVEDTATVTEQATVTIPILTISVDDTTVLVEDVAVSLDVLNASASDTVTTVDSPTSQPDALNISRFDLISVAEFVDVLDLEIDLEVFDAITIVDIGTTTPFTDIDAGDDVAITEQGTASLDALFLSVLDLLTITEFALAAGDFLNINVIDTVSAQDVFGAEGLQAIAVHDNAFVNGALLDEVGIAEFAAVDVAFPIVVHDTITVTEAVFPHDLVVELFAEDSVAVVEAVTMFHPLVFLNVADLVAVTEARVVDLQITITATETLAIIERSVIRGDDYADIPTFFIVTPRLRFFVSHKATVAELERC